jgi:hypothetical protein
MKSIYKMDLHEEVQIGEWLVCMRVAGGWIYSFQIPQTNILNSVFVPFDNEFMQRKTYTMKEEQK